MAITSFIPTIWSENLYTALNKKYVAVANCNRDFEGEIRNRGSVVKICGVGDIFVGDYTKNTDMNNPQNLSDTVMELVIDQAKYFNFQIDDIDKTQASPKLMDAAMRIAADSLARTADRYIYGICNDLVAKRLEAEVTPENILDTIIAAQQRLYEAGVSDMSDVVLEVSPSVASLIMKAKLNLATDNSALLENGCIGSIGGTKIFVSPNIDYISHEGIEASKCVMRTKRAVAFAEQLSEIDAYRPEKRFADAVKGLHLYGASVIYPDEVVPLSLTTTV